MLELTLTILAVVLAVLLVIWIIASFYCLNLAIGRKRKKKPPEDEWKKQKAEIKLKSTEYFLSQEPESVSIKSCKGQKMMGWLKRNENSKRFALCVHGYGSSGTDEFSYMYPFYYEQLGYNYLIPDLTAHGDSEGFFIGFGSFDSKNILLWVNYLIERFGEDIEIILHGISMGAATVMNVNEMDPPPQVKLVIEDCGFICAYDQIYDTAKHTLGFDCKHLLATTSILSKIFAGYHFKESNPLGNMHKAKNPVLFVHGDQDTFVPFEYGKQLYEACPTPKDYFWAPGSKHADSYYQSKEQYEEKVKSFIAKHLDKEAVTE